MLHSLLQTSAQFYFAQESTPPLIETTQLHLSGTRFFITVIAGVVLAFAFQLLLTNLSVALGISLLDTGADSQTNDSAPPIRKIGIAMGIWTLLSVSLALFGACLLALKLSLIATPMQAITLALVIWATYFTLLVWISSTTIGSMIGSVVSTATSGFQAVFGTATAAFGATAARSELISTVEDATAAIRRQVTADVDAEDLLDTVSGYLAQLRSPRLNLSDLRTEFKALLEDPEVSALEPHHLQQINRSAFEELVTERMDIAPQDQERLVTKMEQAWRDAIRGHRKRDRLDEILTYVKSATPQSLLSDELTQQLEQLIQDYRTQPEGESLLSRSFNMLMGVVAGRIDLSDMEVGQISQQVKQAKDQVMNQMDQVYLMLDSSAELPTALETDVENYLLNAQPWQFNADRINTDFRTLLRDPDADLATIAQQIRGLSKMDFCQILKSRGLFTQAKIQIINQQLRSICQEITGNIESLLECEKQEKLSKKTFIYLQNTPKEQLTSDQQVRQAFAGLILDEEASADTLRDRFTVLHPMELMKPLQSRDDLSPEECNQILDDLQDVQNRVLADAESIKASVEFRVERQWKALQNYLSQTGKSELNPQGIQRDLAKLLNDPEAGIHDLQVRLSQFDRDTLVQLLSQRPEFSETEVQQVLNQVEQSWSRMTHAPEILTAKAKAKYDEVTSAIASYLRNTEKAELNPAGIQHDLKLLMNDPQAGYESIVERVSKMDRETLVQLLSQREDMSAEEVNQVIDQVQATLQSFVKAPRRLAKRTQLKIESFQSTLEDYLRSTEKDELSPEGIKRDFKALLEDPRWGMERLGDRLSQVDESTLIALLSQRDDITDADAREMVGQMLAIREQVQQQMTQITDRVKGILNSVLVKI
ncbi:MAG: MFS transporter, partial [Acaryochloridaceae cyanobacterium RL_2_7]|nr:MFS transporter [Acaryochloridaceae cyanobacterium RL_2_7]